MATHHADKLQNRRLLVLGGTSGIGFGVAEAALKSGANVIVSSSNQAKVTKALDRLRSAMAAEDGESNVPVSGFPCDLGDAATLEENLGKMLETATEGRTRLLDHVVFTAGGMLKIIKVPDMTVEAFQQANIVRLTRGSPAVGQATSTLHSSVRFQLSHPYQRYGGTSAPSRLVRDGWHWCCSRGCCARLGCRPEAHPRELRHAWCSSHGTVFRHSARQVASAAGPLQTGIANEDGRHSG